MSQDRSYVIIYIETNDIESRKVSLAKPPELLGYDGGFLLEELFLYKML